MKRWGLTLLFWGWAAAGAAQVMPPVVRSVTLDNGLRVLLAPDSLAGALDVAVWYGAGTRYERAGLSGLTHLMERRMFGGSPRYAAGEHRRLVQAEGGTVNTFTTPDASCFFQTVPAEALDLALRLEADRAGGLKLTQAGLDRERRLARERRKPLAVNTPVARGLRRLYATAFEGHPYGWPVTGLEPDLDRLTLAAWEAYQRERYVPGNAVLTVVGRFDPDQALQLVRRHFGPLPPRAVPASKPAAPAPQDGERRATERTEGEIPVVLVGWRAPGGADRSSVALEVVSRVLTSGSGLRRVLLRPPAPCLAVEGAFDVRRDASLMYVAAALRPGADSAAVERALLAECEKLAMEPVDAAELDRAKREVELALLLEWETAHGRAQRLGRAEAVYGDYRLEAERLQRLRELAPDDLMRAAAAVLRPDQRSVVWLTPAKAAGGEARGKGAAR